VFEASEAFPGPSLYFHLRAIERRRAHNAVSSLLEDDLFLEYVYAVLPASRRPAKLPLQPGRYGLEGDVALAEYGRSRYDISSIMAMRHGVPYLPIADYRSLYEILVPAGLIPQGGNHAVNDRLAGCLP
jgi:hypothetical protein